MWTGLMVGVAVAAPASTAIWVDRTTAPVATLLALGLESREAEQGAWMEFDAPTDALGALDAAGVLWRPSQEAGGTAKSGYTSPEEMVAALGQLVDDHPLLAQPISLGTSVLGRPLHAVRLSATDAPAVEWRLLGAHHGDELVSAELALDSAITLAEGYGVDPQATQILDRDAVWVFPHVNPDGVDAVSRRNANAVDLNRNYSFAWSADATGSGPSPFSEPETRAVRVLSALAPFGAGLSAHAGATNLGWVWNHTHTAPLDEVLVEDLATLYADACSQPGFYTTNGADWYPTNGDTNDWSYGVHGTLDFTLEVSTDKHPDPAAVPALLAHHRDAVLDFLAAPSVAHGAVRDAVTGLPVPATVSLDGGQPLLNGWTGRWGRPVESTFSGEVLVSAPGFDSPREPEPGVWTLEPTSVVDLTVEPPLLSAGDAACVRLSPMPEPGPVTLSRPGHAPRQMDWDPSCEGIWLDTDGLEPGAWTLVVPHGVAPRGLHVGEADNAVEVESCEVRGGRVVLSGHGFGAGTRAYALVTEARLPVFLPVISGSSQRLLLDSTPAQAYGMEALQVLTNGAVLAVVDPSGDAIVDTGAPDRQEPDTHPGTAGEEDGRTPPAGGRIGDGCATAGPVGPPTLALLLPFCAVARRRR